MYDDSNKPIGVFDSGLGGLSVFREIRELLPSEDLIYFGDNARVPYGSKSAETVRRYTLEALAFFVQQGVKAVVIACNTASARALQTARQNYPDLLILGVIHAGAADAVKVTSSKKVAIIGTEGTINSKAYEEKIHSFNPEIEVFTQACPLFVPIVEEGWMDTEVAHLTARAYLEPFQNKNIDTLVLGCTHYPLLMRTIASEVPSAVSLINPGVGTAVQLKNELEERGLLRDGHPAQHRFFVSDQPDRFVDIANRFLGKPIEQIETIKLPGH